MSSSRLLHKRLLWYYKLIEETLSTLDGLKIDRLLESIANDSLGIACVWCRKVKRTCFESCSPPNRFVPAVFGHSSGTSAGHPRCGLLRKEMEVSRASQALQLAYRGCGREQRGCRNCGDHTQDCSGLHLPQLIYHTGVVFLLLFVGCERCPPLSGSMCIC